MLDRSRHDRGFLADPEIAQSRLLGTPRRDSTGLEPNKRWISVNGSSADQAPPTRPQVLALTPGGLHERRAPPPPPSPPVASPRPTVSAACTLTASRRQPT